MPGMKFTVTSDDIEAASSGGGEPAPAGFYDAVVATVDYEAPEDKNSRYHVTYRIINADAQYASIHEYLVLTEASKWKMTQYLLAVGAIKKEGSVDLEKAMVASKGKEVRLRVVNETYTPANGEARITAKPAGTWAPGKGSGAAKAADNGADDRMTELQNMSEDELENVEDEIRALCEPLGVDPDDFSTWAAVLEAMTSGNGQAAVVEGDEPPIAVDERWTEILGMSEDELAEIADELDEYAGETGADLDADAFDTWVEYREAIVEADGGDDAGEVDFNSWSMPELRKELTARNLDSTGKSKAVLVARLQEADADTAPFGG